MPVSHGSEPSSRSLGRERSPTQQAASNGIPVTRQETAAICQLLPLPTAGWGPGAGPLPPSLLLTTVKKKNGAVLWELNKLVIAATSDIQNNG